MNREFKVGDIVVYNNKRESKNWEELIKISVYKKIATIIEVNHNYAETLYYIQFNNHIDLQYDEDEEEGSTLYVTHEEIISLNQLKLKKLVKHGV